MNPLKFWKLAQQLLMGNLIESLSLLRSIKTEHNIIYLIPTIKSFLAAVSKGIKAEVVDLPEVKPHWCCGSKSV